MVYIDIIVIANHHMW